MMNCSMYYLLYPFISRYLNFTAKNGPSATISLRFPYIERAATPRICYNLMYAAALYPFETRLPILRSKE